MSDPAVWHAFGADLARALDPAADPAHRVIRALAALRRWAWSLPAHAPDEPLLEHAQLLAAVAAALWRQQDDPPNDPDRPLCLGLIDLSGIQRYLFGTTSGAGGVARRLRARSLRIGLVAEVLGHALLDALDLPLCNVLATSGGHSYLLLPASPPSEATVEAAWRGLETDLWEAYGSMLTATFVHQPLGAADLSHSGAIFQRLAEQRSLQKVLPLHDLLQDAQGWRAHRWVSSRGFDGRSACDACGMQPAAVELRGDALCGDCASDYRLGAVLPVARYLSFTRAEDGLAAGTERIALLRGYAVQAARDLREVVGTPYLVHSINHFTPPDGALPVIGRYLATYVPVDADSVPLDFGAMATQAAGARLLAVVKADVDRLGALFAWGLQREGAEGPDTLSRSLALSRLVDTFFSGWVHGLLADLFPSCYTIYSGGDDVLVVGPWNQALRFLARVHDDFARYTHHPRLTLSAGVALLRPQTPIAGAVELADAQEALAKEMGADGGRDQVALFDVPLRWERAAALFARWQALAATADRPPSSALHRLLGYARAYQQAEGAGLRALAHMAYDFARNKQALPAPYREEWQRVLNAAFNGEAPTEMEEVGLLARLLILGQRSRA
jgi:CRISPR-associated protein Csm1